MYLTNHSPWDWCDTRSIFKQSTAGSNSVFFLPDLLSTKAKEISLSYYLTIAGERRYGFMHFSRAIAQSETQIWAWVTDLFSYNDMLNTYPCFLKKY